MIVTASFIVYCLLFIVYCLLFIVYGNVARSGLSSSRWLMIIFHQRTGVQMVNKFADSIS